MKPTDTLGHATLADSLNAACYAITGAYIEGTEIIGRIPGVISSGRFDEFIPGLVFDFAVNAGWIPRPYEPEEDHGVVLGMFYVEEPYREWFIGLMDESLTHLREVAAKTYDDDNANEEAGQLRTELCLLALDRGLRYALKKQTGQIRLESQQVQAGPAQTSPEGKTMPMPEWAEAYMAARVPETSSDERRALEDRYLATHKHPVYGDDFLVKELSRLANVNPKQWERWRRGAIANNSQPGGRILKLLEKNIPTLNPNKLPQRKYEKLSI